MRRPSPETLWTFVTAAVLVALVVAIHEYLPSGTFAFALGLVAAVDSGLLVALLTFVAQSPTLEVTIAKDEWDGKSPFKFIHVVVRNSASGFLGGGTAVDCRGEIVVDGSSRPFTPKWATRAEPVQRDFLSDGKGGVGLVQTVNPALIDQCKYETLGPNEERTLDIAVKVNGDPNCYIHEPENYYDTWHKRNACGPGPHLVSLILKHGSRKSGPFEFTLNNGAGTSPASLTITAR